MSNTLARTKSTPLQSSIHCFFVLNTNSVFESVKKNNFLHSQHSTTVFKLWKLPYVLTEQAHSLSCLKAVCIQKLLQSHGSHELATRLHSLKRLCNAKREVRVFPFKSTWAVDKTLPCVHRNFSPSWVANQ